MMRWFQQYKDSKPYFGTPEPIVTRQMGTQFVVLFVAPKTTNDTCLCRQNSDTYRCLSTSETCPGVVILIQSIGLMRRFQQYQIQVLFWDAWTYRGWTDMHSVCQSVWSCNYCLWLVGNSSDTFWAIGRFMSLYMSYSVIFYPKLQRLITSILAAY